ncbi:putative HIT-like protein [Lasiodiplodia theobromae]|uniref:Putative HIT-like protein n=1 Tax=Lasiodiplodia theobromae TaxID=45133 RepID=A0A5N5D456_9PEZI|nr:putative HIT-like protein [Lasiodiplodia theobromae]
MRINAVNKIPLSFLEDDAIEAALSSAPSTPGDTVVRLKLGGNIPATDLTYLGDANEDTANSIFAKIIRGELEQWRLWESASHVAFLTPFGNTPGFTVLVPRKPLGSDILAMAEPDLRELATAIWDVSHLLQSSPALGASRVGLIFEGMEIDYAHAKLIPILDKGVGNPEQHIPEATYTGVYTGSISSRPGPPADLDVLQELQVRLLRAAEMRKS